MDGGIIEGAILDSMMTGAAVGGGSSLLQGKDPLQGALLGGLMGGAGGAMFGGAPTGAMPGATAATPAAPAATPAATAGFESFAPTATQFGAMGEAPLGQSFDSFGSPVAAGSPAATMADPTGLAQQQMAVNAAQAPQSQGIMSGAKDWWGGLSDKQKLLAGGAGIAGLGMISDQMRGGVPKKKPYSGALSRFSYNPDTYVPWSRSFAAGGIAGGSAGDGLGEINNGVSMITDALNTAQTALGGSPGASGGFAGSYPTIPGYGSGDVNPNPAGGTYGIDQPIRDPAPAWLGGFDDSQMGNPMFQRNNNPTGPANVNIASLASKLGVNAGPGFNQTVGQSPAVSMFAAGGQTGGIASLGGYSDGGRMLKGPGDGMSDSIPAQIGSRQPARLADGEFVVPADVVSHLGNGSTDAGAKQLYAMMNKVRKARTGNPKQGKQIQPHKYLPA